MNTEEILTELAQQIIVCTRCKLHHSRKNAVPGAGSADTPILFIGEGPGFYENEQGLPFVGASGKFLDELLGEAGLSRADVFITNVVKCRPPGNRDPEVEELEACKYYLDQQIAAINPDMIVTLGRISMGYFVSNRKISTIHGQSFWSHGRMIVPMYHPAAALHQPSLRSVVKEDFSKLPQLLEKAQEKRRKNPEIIEKTQAEMGDDPAESEGTDQLPLF